MSNFFTLFNLANNRPHRFMLDTFISLEGVSYILNQICKKCTKNIRLFVHLSAAKSASKEHTNFIFIYEVKNAISYDSQIENINLLLQT